MKVEIEISLGELIDKMTILRIKEKKIQEESKLVHVKHELKILEMKAKELDLLKMKEVLELENVNTELWEIEDKIRDKERDNDFGEEFINLARSVYITNDRRFAIKNEINRINKSEIVEVKSYKKY